MVSAGPEVIVVGDVMLDVVTRADALARGGDAPGAVRLHPGGAGANTAAWSVRAGARTTLVARIGSDAAGRLVREALDTAGVEVALVVDPEAPTGTMLVVTEGGERSMISDRGANARLAVEDLPSVIKARAVLVSGYLLFDEASEKAGRAALTRATASVVAVEAASWPPLARLGAERFLSAAEGATLLLANEREAEVLSGAAGAEAAHRLGERFETVVVKRGADGAVAAHGDDVLTVRAPEAPVVDPTGAGDAFDGTLLARLAMGAELTDAIEAAAEAGALAVGREGAWP